MAKILIFLQPDHERSMSVLREEPNWVTASKMQRTFWRIVSWLLRYISITANKTLKPLIQRATYNAQTKCILILVTLYCIDRLELGSAGVRSMYVYWITELWLVSLATENIECSSARAELEWTLTGGGHWNWDTRAPGGSVVRDVDWSGYMRR